MIRCDSITSLIKLEGFSETVFMILYFAIGEYSSARRLAENFSSVNSGLLKTESTQ
jgi:hypothetical protein